MLCAWARLRTVAVAALVAAAVASCGILPKKERSEAPSGALAQAVAAYKAGRDDQAARLLRPLAEQGDPEAQTYLGILYREGRGVPIDHVEAVNWFYKAAERKHPLAQYNLGIVWGSGNGVPQNDEAAAKWYRLAADQGLAEAQFALGYMYAHGRGVPRDLKEARKWYER